MNWLMTGCNPCHYEGIFCDYYNHIESIVLPKRGLTGTLPATMGNLVHLEYLQLEENLLHGTIPSELGSLANLNELKLHDNDLTGGMPDEICALKGWNGIFTYVTSDCGGPNPDVSCHFPDCCSECRFS
ncbi:BRASSINOSTEROID INSENSITIVE 1-associated receptor kinase 1 [Seminavis robusta]|uniref:BRASSINOSTEROID INSENSITIVE 1-associated receptor kinase 1 n=1 Tax=Seminavis robusta TaxID=568900 RepID=A0A9N8HXR8_9STRA|nr:BRASSINOSTEROID INSENSITIVE 1-associated receptor kinase 1 [Seminavis robusta]|eukprot:Sro1854_g301850.1 BRASSINOSTEROID INSENSITIVE 1-associated receptor kinase 1 (129) ;mRNA; r:6267-6850